ncbi:hypothetical protein BGZ89_004250 [Linnemannia elongata]|nr:hypothetical protein BGZ89_004250 [Linnemannia elongata]
MDKLAALGVMHYGITLPGLTPILKSLGLYDPVKSSILKDMNQGGDTMLGVKYLMIVTKYNRIQAVSFEARNPSYTTMSFETGVS